MFLGKTLISVLIQVVIAVLKNLFRKNYAPIVQAMIIIIKVIVIYSNTEALQTIVL